MSKRIEQTEAEDLTGGDFYNAIVCKRHPEDDPPFAFPPTWKQLQASARKFFKSAAEGQRQTENFVQAYRKGRIIFAGISDMQNFRTLNQALKIAGQSRDQVPLIQQGVEDILGENPHPDPKAVEAAENFSSALYTKRPLR
jgi:hypothetical protein